jgi:hypothetical protein
MSSLSHHHVELNFELNLPEHHQLKMTPEAKFMEIFSSFKYDRMIREISNSRQSSKGYKPEFNFMMILMC